jgi:retron-type reverse transcriptase
MKRFGALWPELSGFPNLVRAMKKAARGKRHQPNVAAFLFDQERELCRLHEELADRTYRPGGYRTFEIVVPKPRLISAAPFRDRVVHHALCNVLEPIYERTFIHDSYANRRGKGTHAAVDRFTYYARRYAYVLKADVAKYFPSIDHDTLKAQLRRKIKDANVLWLAYRIIDHSNEQEQSLAVFAGDDLFTLLEHRRGLPLGNQTSQFFANIYLNGFDHFVKEQLRAPGYIRYVDDFVIFHDDKKWLADARQRCRAFLGGLRLRLHPRKAVIARVCDGTPFLGYRVFPDHRLLPKSNLKRLRGRIRLLQAGYRDGILGWDVIRRRMAGWLGHARQADTFQLRQRILADMVFQRRGIASTG